MTDFFFPLPVLVYQIQTVRAVTDNWFFSFRMVRIQRVRDLEWISNIRKHWLGLLNNWIRSICKALKSCLAHSKYSINVCCYYVFYISSYSKVELFSLDHLFIFKSSILLLHDFGATRDFAENIFSNKVMHSWDQNSVMETLCIFFSFHSYLMKI